MFGILHYAGEVFYEITGFFLFYFSIFLFVLLLGFAEKNRDSTNNDMKDLMCKSSNDLLKFMADEAMKEISVSTGTANTVRQKK
jgi:myosin heavy subunit